MRTETVEGVDGSESILAGTFPHGAGFDSGIDPGGDRPPRPVHPRPSDNPDGVGGQQGWSVRFELDTVEEIESAAEVRGRHPGGQAVHQSRSPDLTGVRAGGGGMAVADAIERCLPRAWSPTRRRTNSINSQSREATMANPDATEEMKRLQGTWKQIAYERDGVTEPTDEQGWEPHVTFAGDTFTVTLADGSVPIAGTCRLDPTREPKTVDWTDTIGEDAGKTLLAIYKFEGDQFIFCAAYPAGSGRRRSRPGRGKSSASADFEKFHLDLEKL